MHHYQLVNTLLSNDNLKWLDVCCLYYFDLIRLGFGHDQVLTMALCHRGEVTVRRVVNSFALLQSLGFSRESIVCLVQCDQAYDSVAWVVQSDQFFQQERIFADSLLAILKGQNGCQHLEILVDAYPILKLSYKKELLLEWAARSDGALFLRSKLEELQESALVDVMSSVEKDRSLFHV